MNETPRQPPAAVTPRGIAATAVASMALACLAACSTGAPPAAPSLAAGNASLESARSAGAPELAAAELDSARSKLDRARALAQAGNNAEAMRLAEQADVDAQYARAKAGSERSRRALAEVEASLSSLREELRRAATAQPQPVRPPQ